MVIRLALTEGITYHCNERRELNRHWDDGISPAVYHQYREAKGLGQIVTLRALTGIRETVCIARSQCRLSALSEGSLSCVRLTVSLRGHTLKSGASRMQVRLTNAGKLDLSGQGHVSMGWTHVD